MKHALTIALGILMIAAFVISERTVAQAQSHCSSFKAVAQATLPTTRRLDTADKWGGPLFAQFGDELIPFGILSGNDGTTIRRENIAQGIDGLYVVGFNCTAPVPPSMLWSCTDTLRVEVPIAVFDSPPPLFGRYDGNTARVNGGTGRFANAYGNLNYSGAYIVWTLAQGDKGRFNAELSGRICGIE